MSNFECPVCLDVPSTAPIFQCRRGHIVCNDCKQTLVTCPTCRTAQPFSRALIAEKYLEFHSGSEIGPCPFKDEGCNELRCFKKHNEECPFRPIFCPEPTCSRRIQLSELDKHINNKVCIKNSQRMMQSPTIYKISKDDWHNKISCKVVTAVVKPRYFFNSVYSASKQERLFWVSSNATKELVKKIELNMNVHVDLSDETKNLTLKANVVPLSVSFLEVKRDKLGIVIKDCVMDRMLTENEFYFSIVIKPVP